MITQAVIIGVVANIGVILQLLYVDHLSNKKEHFMRNRDDKGRMASPPIKLIPGSLKRPLPILEEARAARDTWAYWWYRCLQANDEYVFCCAHGGKGELANTYADFGDVITLNFGSWWMKHGRKIFSETQALKKVRTIDDREQLETTTWSNKKLIIEVPLNLRRQTAMRQVGRILKKAYEGREINIWEQSTARRKIIKTKMRMSTVEVLLRVLEVRQRYPKFTLNEVGIRAGVEIDLGARDTTGELPDAAEERRRMTITVARYLAQAKNLITNAGLGKFPSLQKPNAKEI